MTEVTPSVHEKLDTSGQEEPTPLSLDSLDRKLRQVTESQSRIYEVLVKHTEDRVMTLREEQQAREGIYAQGFNMVNATLAAYTAQFDAVLDELHEKVGTDKKEFIKSVQKKTSDIINQQMEMMQKRAEAEGLVKGQPAPTPTPGATTGGPTLTEV